MNHKLIHHHDAAGKDLTCIYDVCNGWIPYRPEELVSVPLAGDSANFLVSAISKEGQRLDLAVLDNYGNEELSPEFRQAIFGGKLSELDQFDYTLSVDWKSGQIYYTGFGLEKGKLIMCISSDHLPVMPKKYRTNVEGLLGMKRPFGLALHETFLRAYINRQLGTNQAVDYLMVWLDFGPGGRMYIWGDSYRFVGQWENSVPIQPNKV